LHDELGQSLTALKTGLTRHAGAPCTDAVWLKECSQLLKESIRSVHEISQLLRPTILDDFGLDTALRWLCERFSDRTGIEVIYNSTLRSRLLRETETHLFRIAQEALTNIERHSGASEVTVRLEQREESACLLIRDNGKGLRTGEQTRHGAFGIVGMQARARSSRGELHISSELGHGAAVEARIPLERNLNESQDSHLVG
jgi:signal transduction histidine kinase